MHVYAIMNNVVNQGMPSRCATMAHWQAASDWV